MAGTTLVLTACCVLGCGTDPAADTNTATVETGSASAGDGDGDLETGTSATDGPSETDGSETEGETGQTKFDTAPLDDLGRDDDVCLFVDALIAVDVSGSMTEEIGAMSDAMLFESFRDTLLEAGNGLVDFQLAIMNDQPAYPYYHDNSGQPSFNDCAFSTGTNYMSSMSPNFEQEFACIFSAAGEGFVSVGDYLGPDADTPLPGLDYLQMASEMPARSAALSVSEPLALLFHPALFARFRLTLLA